MSTQYTRLCATCQTASQWLTFSTNTCTTAGQLIKKENYNEILAGAKSIKNYGYNGTEYVYYGYCTSQGCGGGQQAPYFSWTRTDDGSNELPDVGSLSNINSGKSAVKDDYNTLASKILSSYTAVSAGTIIYGSYFTGLKNGLKNFQFEARRYKTSTCYDNYDNYSNYSNYSNAYSNYSNYSNYTNYSNYSDYTNYSNYSDYTEYSRYSNYSDYSDCGGGCGWQDQFCTGINM